MKKKKTKKKEKTPGLMSLAGRKRGMLFISAFFEIVGTLLSFSPYIGIYLIVKEIIDNIDDLAGASTENFMRIAVLVLIMTSAGLLSNLVANLVSHKAAFDLVYDLRMKFATHIAKLPMGYHTSNTTARTRKVLNDNINKIETFVAHQLPDTIGAFTTPIVAVVLLFVFDWRLGIACLIGLIVTLGIEMYGLSRPAAARFAEEYQEKQIEMTNSAVEYIRGISVVKAFGQTVHSFKNFYNTIKENEKMSLEYAHSVKRSYSLFTVLLNSLFIFVLPVGIIIGSSAPDDKAFAVSFIFYLFFSGALAGPVMKLVYVFTQFHAMKYSVKQVMNIFEMSEIHDKGNIREISNYNIDFKNVSFSYDEEEQTYILKDVSFTAEQGKLTALVGPSGSGKTTIAQLIPRFWDIQKGQIKLGGEDIRDISMDTLMNNVSFVFQDVFLFQKSIMENIRVGREDATEEEVINVAKASMCHDFIMDLPDGYDTVYGKEGIHLSGGEMQRIIIARAILKDAPIVILDEATAFADPENEQKIQTALEVLMKDKTVIVIAHRLSTIRNADKIIVIDDGRIVQQGIHDQLIKEGNKYKEMWDAYSSALTWRIKKRSEQDD